MITKAELSDKLIQLIVSEMPLDKLTSNNGAESKQYIDIITDAMTAVIARMLVAYIGTSIANNPLMDEEEVVDISDMVHARLSKHIDFEATDLMKKLQQKPRYDA